MSKGQINIPVLCPKCKSDRHRIRVSARIDPRAPTRLIDPNLRINCCDCDFELFILIGTLGSRSFWGEKLLEKAKSPSEGR